jgi:hypothetical protein
MELTDIVMRVVMVLWDNQNTFKVAVRISAHNVQRDNHRYVFEKLGTKGFCHTTYNGQPQYVFENGSGSC